jgi:hypothetical protein
MDADRMFPRGFHPVKDILLYDLVTPAPVHSSQGCRGQVLLCRLWHFIVLSYGNHLSPSLVLGRDGRDQDVPELSDEVPYDPFKVDIFTIGNVLGREFCNVSFVPLAQVVVLPYSSESYQLEFPRTPGRIYVSARPE